MNKYDNFFEEIKSFAIHNQLTDSEVIKGATATDISALEDEIDFRFEAGVKSYLSYFGHDSEAWNFDLTKFTIKNILLAEQKANKDSIRDGVLQRKVVNAWDEQVCPIKFKKICFINYFEPNYYFTFINSNDEKSTLFGWDGLEESYNHELSITSNLRGQIYVGLKFICDLRRTKKEKELSSYNLGWYERTKQVNIDELKWLGLFKSKYISNNLLATSKYEFDKAVQIIEKKESRIIGIQEYGETFEKLLKKRIA